MNYGDEAGTKTFSYLHEKTWSNSSLLWLLFVVVVVCCCFCYLDLSTLDANITYIHMCNYKNKNKNNCKKAWQMPQQLCGVASTVCKHTTISSISWVHMGNVAAVESSFGLIKPGWKVEVFFFPFRRCHALMWNSNPPCSASTTLNPSSLLLYSQRNPY